MKYSDHFDSPLTIVRAYGLVNRAPGFGSVNSEYSGFLRESGYLS